MPVGTVTGWQLEFPGKRGKDGDGEQQREESEEQRKSSLEHFKNTYSPHIPGIHLNMTHLELNYK